MRCSVRSSPFVQGRSGDVAGGEARWGSIRFRELPDQCCPRILVLPGTQLAAKYFVRDHTLCVFISCDKKLFLSYIRTLLVLCFSGFPFLVVFVPREGFRSAAVNIIICDILIVTGSECMPRVWTLHNPGLSDCIHHFGLHRCLWKAMAKWPRDISPFAAKKRCAWWWWWWWWWRRRRRWRRQWQWEWRWRWRWRWRFNDVPKFLLHWSDFLTKSNWCLEWYEWREVQCCVLVHSADQRKGTGPAALACEIQFK